MPINETSPLPGLVKMLCLIYITLSSLLLHSQTCLNPSYKLHKLRAEGVTKDSINNWIKNDLAFLQLQTHDTVADIGSFNGYYPALYSVSTDSIRFYLNDIVTEGFIYFDSIRTLCSELSDKPFTNTFSIVKGTANSTLLSSATFHKVILRDALHHFNSIPHMLADIKRILRPDGKLLLFEPIRNHDVINTTLCRGSMTEDELLKLMEKNGFILMRQTATGNDRFWFEFKMK